jgi:hypothetical protein
MCQQRCLERGWSLGLECPPRGRQQRGVDHSGTMAVEHSPNQAAPPQSPGVARSTVWVSGGQFRSGNHLAKRQISRELS